MDQSQRRKLIKIFYFNSQKQWVQYGQAIFSLESTHQSFSLNLTLLHQPTSQKLQILPLNSLSQKSKTLIINEELLTNMEKSEQTIIFIKIEQWNKSLALSFCNQNYCELVWEQLEPFAEKKVISSAIQNKELSTSDIENCIELALSLSYGTDEGFKTICQIYCELKEKKVSVSFSPFYQAIKKILLNQNKKYIENLLIDTNFNYVLQFLSYNHEFGDRQFNYLEQYRALVKITNVLQIKDEELMIPYENTIKVKFLRDVAMCMFIEMNTEIIFMCILGENNLRILSHLSESQLTMKELKGLKESNKLSFIEVCIELWETFKAVIEDEHNKNIKQSFYQLFLHQHLFPDWIQALHTIITLNHDERIYQKFVESLNPLLSYDWENSQNLLLREFQSGRVHLLQFLLEIISKCSENLKYFILIFIKNLIEVTQNRKSMKNAFLAYVYEEFINKSFEYFNSVEELEMYGNFLVKVYEFDPIRGRRSIIEQKVFKKLNANLEVKYVLMMTIKLLKSFISSSNSDIFDYLVRNQCFARLRQKYIDCQSRNKEGAISSLFLSLFKDVENNQNKTAKKFVFSIMFPNEKIE